MYGRRSRRLLRGAWRRHRPPRPERSGAAGSLVREPAAGSEGLARHRAPVGAGRARGSVGHGRELAEAQRRICGSALHLVQAIVGAGLAPVPRIWVATGAPNTSAWRRYPSRWRRRPCSGSAARSAPSTRSFAAPPSTWIPHGWRRGAVRWRRWWPPTIRRRKRPSERCPPRPRLVRRRATGGTRGPRRLRAAADRDPRPRDAGHRRVPAGGSPGARPGEVEIQVQAAGLNFRDLLNALGLRKRSAAHGRRVRGHGGAVGEGVTGLQSATRSSRSPGRVRHYAIARAESWCRSPRT